MKLVLPMLLFALALGLITRRNSLLTWVLLGTFIAAMIAYTYYHPL